MRNRNITKPQERTALYARVSSQMQVEDGISIAAQLAEMREFAAKRNWAVTVEFVDAGLSGQTLERQGLQSMLSAVQAGSIDIVLVHELSRLSRTSVFETFSIFEILGASNVGFASVREPNFDLSTPQDVCC